MSSNQLGLSISEAAVALDLDFGNVPYAVQDLSKTLKEILNFSESEVNEKSISNSRVLCVAIQKIFFSIAGFSFIFPGKNTESMSAAETLYYLLNEVSLERFLGTVPIAGDLKRIFPSSYLLVSKGPSEFLKRKKEVSELLCSDEKEFYNPYLDQGVGTSSRKFLKTCLSLMFLERNFLKNKNSLSLGGLSTSYSNFLDYYSSFSYGMKGTPAIEYILSREGSNSVFKDLFGALRSSDPDLVNTDVMPAESSENYLDFSFNHTAGLDEFGNIENYNFQTNQNKVLNEYSQKLNAGLNKISQDISKLAFNLEQNEKLFRIQREYMNDLHDVIFDVFTSVFNGENHRNSEEKLATLSQIALMSNYKTDDSRMTIFLSLFADYLDGLLGSNIDYRVDSGHVTTLIEGTEKTSGPNGSKSELETVLYKTPYYRVNSPELSMYATGRLSYLYQKKLNEGDFGIISGFPGLMESARLRCLALIDRNTINRNTNAGYFIDGYVTVDDPNITGDNSLNTTLVKQMSPPDTGDVMGGALRFTTIVGECFGNDFVSNGLISSEQNIYTPGAVVTEDISSVAFENMMYDNIDAVIGFSISDGTFNVGDAIDTSDSDTNNLSYYRTAVFNAPDATSDVLGERNQIFKQIFNGRQGLLPKIFDHAYKLYIYSLNDDEDTTLLSEYYDIDTVQATGTKKSTFLKMFNILINNDTQGSINSEHPTGIDLFTICYALFEYVCDMIVNSKAKFNIVMTPPRPFPGTDSGGQLYSVTEYHNGNVYVETLKSEILKLMSTVSFTSETKNRFFSASITSAGLIPNPPQVDSPVKGRDYVYNISDSASSAYFHPIHRVGQLGLRVSGENEDEIRYRNLSYFARMYKMREKDIITAKDVLQKLLDYREKIQKFNNDLSSFIASNYSFNSYINVTNSLTNNALKKLILNQINTKEHIRSISTNYLKDYCMGKNSNSYQTLLTSNLANSGPVQLKSMLKFFGNPGYGYLQSEKLGNQRTLFVGIPIGFLKLAQDRAYAKTLDESYLNSKIIVISVYRKNEMNPNEKVYPKMFVFDMSKYVLSESIDNVIEQTFSSEYSDADDFESFLSKHEVFKIESDPDKFDTSSLSKNFKKYKGKAFNNEDSDTNLTSEIKRSIFKNLIADYYLKMYYRIVLGIDVQESNFKVDRSIFDFNNPDPDYQELFNNIFNTTLINLGIDPGALSQEDINSSTLFRQISLTMRELKNSSLFKQESNRRSVLIPDAFSRIFGLFFNERDFVIYRGDDTTMQTTDSQQDLFNYSIENTYVDLPVMTLDGQKSIKAPHLLKTEFENYSEIFSNKYKDYINSMKTSGTSFYSYYCTVSILKNSLNDDE